MPAPTTPTERFLASKDAMECMPREEATDHGHVEPVDDLRTDLQRADAGADTRVHHRSLLAPGTGQPRPRLRGETTVTWSEQPASAPAWTPREWAFYATCAQMRADRRREEARAERREFWRETKCELWAALAAFATVAVLVGVRLLVMS